MADATMADATADALAMDAVLSSRDLLTVFARALARSPPDEALLRARALSSARCACKAFSLAFGDEKAWEEWDATALIKSGRTSDAHILIDQGEEDEFLEEHLKPEIFEAAARETGQSLSLRRQPGYDHSYYFISTFIDDHLEWHARALD